ncbi:putative serine/threonine-protein phosphatase Ecym_6464 [Eremothecium cymbalariae DBVPG|uniref:Calcineurin-like phosphoesterase domain-containing protein n=1 Tax=Eremothecium cymbalariae (strain CBS 270.75 / DBVPG 7215 / KCTC 17166 / NRRL Y-17582) TaxID=931890 RepID=G8JUQ5_ERECY|nr:hypothetical protein Ecym_6464 [Eremothecium cymbalariae DBVPG\
MKLQILTLTVMSLVVFMLYCHDYFGLAFSVSLPVIATSKYYGVGPEQRLIFVGDVHGMYDKFMLLLKQVKPDDRTTVVLLGDFLSKGPDSAKIARYLLRNKDRIQCVLGNHELAILFALLNPKKARKFKPKRKMDPGDFSKWKRISFVTEDYIPQETKIKKMHMRLARQLGPDVLDRIADHCSAAAYFNLTATNETLIGVHAGILPNGFEHFKIADLTMMKFVDADNWNHTSKNRFDNAIWWHDLWNSVHDYEDTTVLYGHASSAGLTLRRRTKGLDVGCVNGGSLAALEYTFDDTKKIYNTNLYQVPCK